MKDLDFDRDMWPVMETFLRTRFEAAGVTYHSTEWITRVKNAVRQMWADWDAETRVKQYAAFSEEKGEGTRIREPQV